MENDTTEKTLGQIAFEAAWPGQTASSSIKQWDRIASAVENAILSRHPSPAMAGELTELEIERAWNASIRPRSGIDYDATWKDVGEVTREFFRNVIQRLRSASPITQTPQLTEEESIKLAFDEFGGSRDAWCTWDDDRKDLFRRVFQRLSIPALLGYYKTAEKPPKDADFSNSIIFGWSVGAENWLQRRSLAPLLEEVADPYWLALPIPPAPVSPVTSEEAAFNAHVEAQFGKVHFQANRDAVRTTWEAAKTFFTGEGK